MSIICGLANEDYKYIYGVDNPYTAPINEECRPMLVCARNDCAALQLLIYSDSEMVVCVNRDAYFYEKGPVDILRVDADIPGMEKAEIELKLIGLVEDDDRQKKSDILLEQPYIFVEARKVQAI